MDIPDTEYWCTYRAALWIITGSFEVREAVLDRVQSGPVINALANVPWCNALTWLEEHKSAKLLKFQGWLAGLALKLAFDELALEVWNGHVGAWKPDGVETFERFSELRAWIEYERRYVQVQQLVKYFPIPERRLSDREQAARDCLEGWKIRPELKDPYYGAWLGTVRHIATACGCTEEAAKKAVGPFITDEINRLRKIRRNTA